MKDLESRIIEMVPEECPVIEKSGLDIVIPTVGIGTAYCMSTLPGNPVCNYCKLREGVVVDHTNPN